MLILRNIWTVLEILRFNDLTVLRFNGDKLPARKYFFSSIKDGKIGDDGKISDGHIDVNDYLTCKKTWDKFEIKNMSDYHDHYLNKDVLLLADVYWYMFKIL